jgi:beta-glucosidase
MSFPSNFTWGAATASYQIEGAAREDGRGSSVWDTFAATPGKVFNGDNGDVACDHYHRMPQDVAMMKDLGLQAYRFSIAWPRLFPAGDSRREQRGFDFYSRLIDELLENGIKPLPTMYHWDLPQALQDVGGWANRDTAMRFGEYAGKLVEAYSDRVDKWITLNEPWCFTWLGYMSGVHAPGVQDLDQAIAAAHHSALGHAEAVRATRAIDPTALIGQTLNMTNYRLSDPNDLELQELASLQDAQLNRWWIEAEQTGHYPSNLVDYFGDRLSRVMLPGDNELLKVKTDFLGINYYSDSFLSTPGPDDKRAMDNFGPHPFPQRVSGRVPEPTTDMGWPITPDGIKNLLLRIKRDWPQIESIAVTENGAAYDYPVENGEVNDHLRVDYIVAHLEQLSEAIELGVPLDAYFAWSLMDNYEWAEGYRKRFGIVHVDFETQERYPKLSAKVYKDIISSNGANIRKIIESIRV